MYKIGSGNIYPGNLIPVPAETELVYEGRPYGVRSLQEIPNLSAINYRIHQVDRIGTDEGGLNMDPLYQRGHVWDTRHESEFIGYLLKGGKSGPIWVNRYETAKTGGKDYINKECTVIDGKQRLTALIRWAQGEIPALLYGREIWYRELSEIDRRGLPVLDVIYVNMTEKEQMKLYLNLNGGVAHTDAELDRVRGLIETSEG